MGRGMKHLKSTKIATIGTEDEQLELTLDEHLPENTDFVAIAEMLIKAREWGLSAEAVMSFGQARADGFTVVEATNITLSEWDL